MLTNKASTTDALSLSVQRTRYVREDGLVAVLIHTDFGGGWSTWMDNEVAEAALFDPYVVDMVMIKDKTHALEEAFVLYCKGTYGTEPHCNLNSLAIVWLEFGTEFYVSEYDGRESIKLKSDFVWKVV